MSNDELGCFLREQCKERGLSLRSLSIKSELSPGTVHGIITRKYQPTLFSLNCLADYLGVRRQYLWQLAGLLEDMDYDAKTEFGDPQLRFHFARGDKLPKEARSLVISLIESVIIFLNIRGGGDKDSCGDIVVILKKDDVIACAQEMGIAQEAITDDVLGRIKQGVQSALEGSTEVVKAAIRYGARAGRFTPITVQTPHGMAGVRGAPPLGDSMKSIYEAQFGDHNCVVYNSRHDLNDLLAQYFKYGLENGEFCIWVTPGADNDNHARRALDRILPDSKKRLIKEHIEFLDCADFYLKGGSFNPDLVLKQWLDRLNRAIGEGYKGMRVTGDVGWLQKTDWQSFMDYETKINQIIGLNKLVVVCSYPLAKLGASEMVDIMQRHTIAVTKNNGEWHMFEPLEAEKPAES